MSTLTNGATPVALPDDLVWIDEFEFTAVAQRTGRTVTGALYVEEVALSAGRPLTLQGGDDRAWIARSVLETLRTWAQTPNTLLTLNLRGTDYSVVFDRQGGKPVEARAVMPLADNDPADAFVVTLHFLVVA
jgi:hypothetical protein